LKIHSLTLADGHIFKFTTSIVHILVIVKVIEHCKMTPEIFERWSILQHLALSRFNVIVVVCVFNEDMFELIIIDRITNIWFTSFCSKYRIHCW